MSDGTQHRFSSRQAISATLAAVLTTFALATPSAGAVTIGQLAPAPSVACSTAIDRGPGSTVTSGPSYVVPSTGGVSDWTLTSWSHNARAGDGQQMAMKIFRKVAEPSFYQVVAHDGPRPLQSSLLNTFPVSIRVKSGDFLGLNSESPVANTCIFSTGDPGDASLTLAGNLADGQSASFTSPATSFRLNISAEVSPTNAFTLGAVTHNRSKGTATITANVPNPGGLAASGKGVKAAGARISKAVGAGQVKLTIRAKGKRLKKLNETGKVKLTPTLTYTPTGGNAATQTRKVKLRKKL